MLWLRNLQAGVQNWGLKMAEDKLTDHDLEAVFAAARRQQPEPGADWLVRVADDAAREQAWITAPEAPRPSFWEQISAMLGGWRGLGGMAVACGAGVWIGFASPSGVLEPVSSALLGTDAVEMLTSETLAYSALLGEG